MRLLIQWMSFKKQNNCIHWIDGNQIKNACNILEGVTNTVSYFTLMFVFVRICLSYIYSWAGVYGIFINYTYNQIKSLTNSYDPNLCSILITLKTCLIAQHVVRQIVWGCNWIMMMQFLQNSMFIPSNQIQVSYNQRNTHFFCTPFYRSVLYIIRIYCNAKNIKN